MPQPVCHLDEFFMTRVNVAWHEPGEAQSVDIDFLFDYDVFRHTSEKNRFRLAFRLAAKSKTQAPVDYALDTEIVGFFHFSEDSSEEIMQRLIRYNGCTILYGILRGQVANITGSFPSRKFILPTVMMEDVVNDIERKRAKADQVKPPAKKSTKKTAAKQLKPSTKK
jgi:preprotein translocase subunit SecB